MSSALKLEPRCPEPARLTATSAFSRQTSAISASRASASPSAARNAVDVLLRDERELRHARETVTDGEATTVPASVVRRWRPRHRRSPSSSPA